MLRLPAADDVRSSFRDSGVLPVRAALDATTASQLAEEAVALGRRSGRHILRTSEAGVLDYGVITGDVVRDGAPAMYALYESSDLVEWIRAVTETPAVGRSPHLRSAINVNILATAGQQYRWHTDAVPFTVLLFLTTLPPDAGGAFLIRTGGDEVLAIPPGAGDLVLLDGRRCPHAVEALRRDVLRISVPMVFPAASIERPAGLDDYLYAT